MIQWMYQRGDGRQVAIQRLVFFALSHTGRYLSSLVISRGMRCLTESEANVCDMYEENLVDVT